MTPDELASLLDEARTGQKLEGDDPDVEGFLDLTLADRLDEDDRGGLVGGLL